MYNAALVCNFRCSYTQLPLKVKAFKVNNNNDNKNKNKNTT